MHERTDMSADPTTSTTAYVIPTYITCKITAMHVTRFGRKLFGMPAEKRASRGFRRYTRRMKAMCK